MNDEKETKKIEQNQIAISKELEKVLSSKPPSVFRLFMRELKYDKFAAISIIVLIFIFASIFILTPFINANYNIMNVDLPNRNLPPSQARGLYSTYIPNFNPNIESIPPEPFGFLGINFGTNDLGRDITRLTIVGARNSLIITLLVTFFSFILSLIVGVASGFYGGHTDNIIMRIIDTWSMIPTIMFLIAVISTTAELTMPLFIFLLVIVTWVGRTRLFRAAALQNRNMDYISASKTLGTRNIVIIFREMMPNLVDVIMPNFVLTLAANVGIEVGLTILGFGLGWDTPTLGTLINQATDPGNLQLRPWVWAPAISLVAILTLCIHFVGTALQRVSDPKQRYA